MNSTIIGLLPAGGRATRLGEQPTSKEILSVAHPSSDSAGRRSGPVSTCLIETFGRAGIPLAYFILAPGKWDIPAHFGSGGDFGVGLAYLVRSLPFGVPFTLDTAYAFIRDRRVAFGFPDILFRPTDAVARMVGVLEDSRADVVLGVFPVEVPEKWDALKLDDSHRVMRVLPKPHADRSGFTWILAVWEPSFSDFMHGFVRDLDPDELHAKQIQDISLGVVVQAAIESGLLVRSVVFDEGCCLDIGTPSDLAKARETAWWQEASPQ